jgi:acylphosphatase
VTYDPTTGDGLPDARLRVEARVRGVVQGVGYRWWTLETATDLGLDGWVANELDGSVSVVAEGPRALLEELLRRLGEGPGGAVVHELRVRWEPARDLAPGFRIEHGFHRGD